MTRPGCSASARGHDGSSLGQAAQLIGLVCRPRRETSMRLTRRQFLVGGMVGAAVECHLELAILLQHQDGGAWVRLARCNLPRILLTWPRTVAAPEIGRGDCGSKITITSPDPWCGLAGPHWRIRSWTGQPSALTGQRLGT